MMYYTLNIISGCVFLMNFLICFYFQIYAGYLYLMVVFEWKSKDMSNVYKKRFVLNDPFFGSDY